MPYAPATEDDLRVMLERIGVSDVDALFADLSPSVRFDGDLELPEGISEAELVRRARDYARDTVDLSHIPSFLGAGCYDHFVPAVVRALTARSEFATAYTPYQPELSQGTLQTIFEFQSSIAALTGLPIANASLYDGATAVAEAAYLAEQSTRRTNVVVLDTVSPHVRDVLATYAAAYDMTLHVIEHDPARGTVQVDAVRDALGANTAALVVQQPNAFGLLEAAPELCQLAHDHGAVAVVSADPVSLGMLEAPGAYGADVVVGDGQPLGIAPSMGGPTFGFMSCAPSYLRRMPGRIVGETVDTNGERGFVLTMQTREQHIRREKATSNICTNQALCALAGLIHLAWLGPTGIEQLAARQFERADSLVRALSTIDGVKVVHDADALRFRDVLVTLPIPAHRAVDHCLEHGGVLAGWPAHDAWPALGPGALLLAATELRTDTDIDQLVRALRDAIAAVSQEESA